MSRLFDRSYKLTVDDIGMEGGGVGTAARGLDIKFKVVTTTKKDPNKIDLDIYNLNPDHRNSLLKESGSQVSKSKRKPVPVVLEAGYVDGRGVIFRGELRNMTVATDSTEKIVKLSGSDSGHGFNVADLAKSYAPGSLVMTVVQDCVSALGIGVGNLSSFSDMSIAGLGSIFPEGYSVSGSAEATLTDLLFSAGLTWSVQKGVLQVKRNNRPVDEQVYLISPTTGLIGSPEPEIDASVIPTTSGAPKTPVGAKRTGAIKVRTLLLHQLYPGSIITLESEAFNGGYQITQIEFIGDTSGDDWYSDLLVRPY
jgi:hypothetical protein